MSEFDAHAGMWGIALIVIVVVSWLFYRYFVPRSWREWAGAGLVQAFIIALYAEMSGFPLTIYLLVRFAGLDREYVSANLWSTLRGAGGTGLLVSTVARLHPPLHKRRHVSPRLASGLSRCNRWIPISLGTDRSDSIRHSLDP